MTSELLLPIQRTDTHRPPTDLLSIADSLYSRRKQSFSDVLIAHAERPVDTPNPVVTSARAHDSESLLRTNAQSDADTAPPVRNSDAQNSPTHSKPVPESQVNTTSIDSSASQSQPPSPLQSDDSQSPTEPTPHNVRATDIQAREQPGTQKSNDGTNDQSDQTIKDSAQPGPTQPVKAPIDPLQQAFQPPPARQTQSQKTAPSAVLSAPSDAPTTSAQFLAPANQQQHGAAGDQQQSGQNQSHSRSAQITAIEPTPIEDEVPAPVQQAPAGQSIEHESAPTRADPSLDPVISTLRLGGEEGDRSATATRLISSTNTAPTPEPISEPVGSQAVRGMMAMVRAGGGRLTMKLEPESLGSMRIQLNISHGRVQAQFHASSLQVRELLHQQTESLRTALENQGLRLDRVQIHALQPGSEGDASRSGSQNNRSDHEQHHDAGDQQSRGSSEREQTQSDQQDQDNRNRQAQNFAQRFERLHGVRTT